METNRPGHLEQLLALAREYDRKYRELVELAQTAEPRDLFQRIKFQGEMATDRFRNAQKVVLAFLDSPSEVDRDAAIQAMTALCRSFDEMVILHQVLLEQHGRTMM